MVSDLVNIIMFKLYRVSKISHNWYMQMILIRFLQCYQSAFTLNHIFCHTCSLYNMNMHNILHIIYVAYIMPDNIFILIHLKKFEQELLKYDSCSLSISSCSPKCSPNLHHRRLIFQQGDLCFSLHVSLFG